MNVPMIEAVEYYKELTSPISDGTPPELTKEAENGFIKLEKLTELLKQGEMNPEELENQALSDPEIQEALDYEQALNENSALRERLKEQQMQQQQMQQAIAQQQQQMQAAMQQAAQLQQQLQAEQQMRQAATQSAVAAKDQALSAVVEQQKHREQIMQAADQLSDQLKQIASTSPTEQAQIIQQQQQMQQQQQQQIAQESGTKEKTQEEVQQAQDAKQNAIEQSQEAQQAVAEENAEKKVGMQTMASAGSEKLIDKIAKNIRIGDESSFSVNKENLPPGYSIRPESLVRTSWSGEEIPVERSEIRRERENTKPGRKRHDTVTSGLKWSGLGAMGGAGMGIRSAMGDPSKVGRRASIGGILGALGGGALGAGLNYAANKYFPEGEEDYRDEAFTEQEMLREAINKQRQKDLSRGDLSIQKQSEELPPNYRRRSTGLMRRTMTGEVPVEEEEIRQQRGSTGPYAAASGAGIGAGMGLSVGKEVGSNRMVKPELNKKMVEGMEGAIAEGTGDPNLAKTVMNEVQKPGYKSFKDMANKTNLIDENFASSLDDIMPRLDATLRNSPDLSELARKGGKRGQLIGAGLGILGGTGAGYGFKRLSDAMQQRFAPKKAQKERDRLQRAIRKNNAR